MSNFSLLVIIINCATLAASRHIDSVDAKYFHEAIRSKMNAILFLAVIALAASQVVCYDEIYDKIDVDKIMADDALFSAYIDCMLDKGPCEVEHSSEFKKLLPEVIATSCAKCSPIQKTHVKKTVKALGERRPEDLMAFKKKYDPKGEHEASFTQFVLSPDE